MSEAMCAMCGDVIESKHRHDFVRCKCGESFLDGGDDYTRWGGRLIFRAYADDDDDDKFGEYLDIFDEYHAEQEAMEGHWANDLLDSPWVLISVIETKLARAALSREQEIIDLAKEWIDEYEGHDGECECRIKAEGLKSFIDYIKGESK